MAVAVEKTLLTAEEFLRLPNDGRPRELVRGRIVYMNVPMPRHGQICGQVYYLLRRHLEEHPLGHVVCNDSGVQTERGPDTVRGADVAFYSYSRVPPGPLPQGYLPVVPELVFEVRSPTDRWGRILAKVAEYLEAGVTVVCVLDQMTEQGRVYRSDDPGQEFTAEQELTIPDVLPDFRVVVQRFFE
ncbi:MAG TPA: Uma2 family endonuclease [Gemmataceae bacterium]